MPDAAYSSLRSLGERARWIVIGAFAVGFLFAVANAAITPFWFDELLTFYVSRLGSPAEIWAALESTADGQPPFSYLVTWCFYGLLGETELATRLLSLLGFAITTYVFYLWIAERIGALHGVIAIGFLWTTLLFKYSFEARPYALLTACVALSLLLWRRACDGQGRLGALLGLACVVAVAMGSHYYAIFSLFPVGAGELARTWRRRKLDVPFWLALAAGSATVLLYLPLIEGARKTYSVGFWSPVGWEDLMTFYVICLYTSGLSLLAYPYMIAAGWNNPKTLPGDDAGNSFPVEESVAMWALTLTPILTALAVMWTTGAYVFRYSLPAALGLAWIYAVFSSKCTYRRRRAAWVVVGIVAASFVVKNVMRAKYLVPGYLDGFRTETTFASMEQLEPAADLPIVVTSPVEYFVFQHYAPEPWRSRLVYITDPEQCLSVAKHQTIEVILNLFTRWAPLQVEARSEYLNRGSDFLLLDPLYDEGDTWLPFCRKFDMANLVRLHETNEFVLYRWSRSPEAGTDEKTRLQSEGRPKQKRNR